MYMAVENVQKLGDYTTITFYALEKVVFYYELLLQRSKNTDL